MAVQISINTNEKITKLEELKNLNLDYNFIGYSAAEWESKIYLFGGKNENFECNSKMIVFDIVKNSIQEIKTEGSIPQARSGHSCIRYQNILIFFGGVGDESYFNDIHFYYPEKNVFEKIISESDKPEPVANHSVVLRGDEMYIFGGFTKNGLSNNLYIYNIRNNIFMKPFFYGDFPQPREFFGMTMFRDNLIIFGGYSNSEHLNDMYFLDLNSKKWEKQIFSNSILPEKRQKLDIFMLNDNLVILGGCDYKLAECYDDLWIYDFDSNSFKKISSGDLGKIGEINGVSTGSNYYFFNNCEMEEKCKKSIYRLHFKFTPTQKICNDNGIWAQNSQCGCFYGYYGNFCQFKNNCYFLNCRKDSFCMNYENCDKICSKINCDKLNGAKNTEDQNPRCLNNCTSSDHGFCQFDGICICRSSWTGEDCSIPNTEFVNNFETLPTVSTDPSNRKLNYQMFGFNFQSDFQKSVLKKDFSKFEKLSNCKDECSYR